MKLAKTLFVALSVLALGAYAEDPTEVPPATEAPTEEVKTDAVSVRFLGSSGGMVLFPNGKDADSIMIQQGKLEEVTASGSKVNKDIKMQNGEWSALRTEGGEDKTVYSIDFTKTERSGSKFKLTAHLARTTTTTEELRACSGCASETSGDCKNSTNFCDALNEESVCAEGFTRCSETVTVESDELKFSIIVSDWGAFKAADNKLHYELYLKAKNKDDAEATISDDGKDQKKATFDGGYIQTPTKAKFVGGEEEDTEVDVEVSTKQEGGKMVIAFDFPAIPEGRELYYDPDVGVDGATSGASAAVAGPLAALFAVVGAWCLM